MVDCEHNFSPPKITIDLIKVNNNLKMHKESTSHVKKVKTIESDRRRRALQGSIRHNVAKSTPKELGASGEKILLHRPSDASSSFE